MPVNSADIRSTYDEMGISPYRLRSTNGVDIQGGAAPGNQGILDSPHPVFIFYPYVFTPPGMQVLYECVDWCGDGCCRLLGLGVFSSEIYDIYSGNSPGRELVASGV